MYNNHIEILEYIKEKRAIDFSTYRPNTIRRRLDRRLYITGMPDMVSYYKYLRENPAEIDELIDSFAIKVSHFFRNPLIFEALNDIVLPELLDNHKNGALRIWCAGCAKGEEPYSIAILIKELISKEALIPQVYIIGTDIDREAMEEAKKAVYKTESVLEVKKKYLDKYFALEDGLYALTDDIKSMVTFSYHDITAGTTPKEGIFADYHLILCRNVLIYFDRSVCERVLRGFFKGIPHAGYLALGEAESLSYEIAGGFQEVLPNTKIFRKL